MTMLAGVPVSAAATGDLASIVRSAGAGELADRLERALADEVKLLALTIDERALILAALEDPPDGLAELRGVLLNEHQWRQGEGLDSVPGIDPIVSSRARRGKSMLPRIRRSPSIACKHHRR